MLDDSTLLFVYQNAVEKNLDAEFIQMLLAEINARNLLVKAVLTDDEN